MSISYKVGVLVGRVINTKVITTVTQLDQCLSDLLASISQDLLLHAKITSVVGLDIEKDCNPYPGTGGLGNYQVAEKVALVKLCYESSCLLIQLKLLEASPCSLSKFLQLNSITFVGVGIKHCLEALDMNYGIKCRNAVDLGQLVAKTREPQFEWCPLLDLVKKLYYVDESTKKRMSSFGAVAMSNWGATVLSQQQIEAATFDAYACFYFGKSLLNC